ncbi:MAG: membrane protein insertase YidC [Saprospiraceae bacterium]
MDKNSIIGLILIGALFLFWIQINAPTPEEIAERRIQDSISNLAAEMPLETKETAQDANLTETTPLTTLPDSLKQVQLAGSFGAFSASAAGTATTEVLENDLIKVSFSTKGGRITEVLLKDYHKILTAEDGTESKGPLSILEDPKNKFEYLLPVAGVAGGFVSTGDLFFTARKEGQSIIFQAPVASGGYFEQRYTIGADYTLAYDLRFEGLNQVIPTSTSNIQLNWINYLDKLEKNEQYERYYTSIYYKEVEEDPDYCNCRSDDEVNLKEQKVEWISHSNQFFNSTLIAKDKKFNSANLETVMEEEGSEDLKKLKSLITLPYASNQTEQIAMNLYLGPNKFEELAAFDNGMENIIPFGWSIFGTINRWVIRPLFNTLSGFIGNMGIVILVLTFFIKLVLYPLTYKMLYSQSKMGALKPQIAAMKDKFGDDAQKQQLETMKLYREFGVSPLGGCMPMVIQMPIWFALYRFFPASIDFRQADFLWATDLSSYDVAMSLPFEIPFYGAHVSLFTLLWAGTTLIYTYYNTKHMDMTANPAMKYMQYGMPVMFLFFFNNFASGLTCYLLFSNLFNIAQTIITKNFIINQDKIKEELEAYRKKPKKKGGFQARLESAMKEQQRIQKERDATKKKKK